MIVLKAVPRYWIGGEVQRGDEFEVVYRDLHGIPHRGIIHSFQTGPMGVTGINVVHNSKRDGGVSFISFVDYARHSGECPRNE